MAEVWSDEEDSLLIENASKGAAWASEHLPNRSYASVCLRRKTLADKGMISVQKKLVWTPAMDSLIRDNVDKGVRWVAERLGVSERTVVKRRRLLGIEGTAQRKSVEWTEEQDLALVRAAIDMTDTGHTLRECLVRLAVIISAYRRQGR